MNRADLIAMEIAAAAAYEREAKRRRHKNPALAAELLNWAQASRARAERMRCGPLFGGKE